MKKYLLALLLLTAACAPQLVAPETAVPATVPPAPINTATAVKVTVLPTEPIPTPNYIQSDSETLPVELGQLFALRRDQAAYIQSEDLTILHTTDIEFVCPDDAACEVPLSAQDYFEVFQADESLGVQPWQPEMVFGDYVLTTARFWLELGYDYGKHQFEIILVVERQEAVIAAQQTRAADTAAVEISENCAWSVDQYIAGERSTPEVHMLGIYKAGSGWVDVYVERTIAPIILVLSAYEATEWRLHLSQGVSLQSVILNGYKPQTVIGAEDASLINRSGIGNYVTQWKTSELGFGLFPRKEVLKWRSMRRQRKTQPPHPRPRNARWLRWRTPARCSIS